ncbi:sorting nexin [Culex quinquefasciatus]|uniref:Sorting nexin n=1 Tax=Culex quinquefasciatus TaxID=7176 RepID=B0W945_CULQU|nr:sorting nexin [Culex quinquefasciatus]|eukprot:XP_001845229.1 sorting nexin [Culex quinquefasciatus]
MEASNSLDPSESTNEQILGRPAQALRIYRGLRRLSGRSPRVLKRRPKKERSPKTDRRTKDGKQPGESPYGSDVLRDAGGDGAEPNTFLKNTTLLGRRLISTGTSCGVSSWRIGICLGWRPDEKTFPDQDRCNSAIRREVKGTYFVCGPELATKGRRN